MNKLHTYITESEAEWIEKFTTDDNLGQQVQLSNFLVNDDGYQEPYAGGNTNEVHQHLKWLKSHNKAILERVVEMVKEHQKTTFNIEKIGEITLDRPVVYCEDLKAQLTESK